MNKSSEFFRPLIIIFLVTFALASSIFGFPAVLLYLITVKLIYPVFISMAIHECKEKNRLLIESDKDDNWDSYFFGDPIPVKETRDTLKNIHFNNKKIMKASYFKLLAPKVIVIFALLTISVQSVYNSPLYDKDLFNNETLFFLSFGYISIIYIAYKLLKCIKLIQAINSDSWCIKEQQLDKTTYYSAYIKESEKYYLPFLSEVFK